MSNSKDVAELTQRNLDDMSDSERLQRLLSSKMMMAGTSANGNSQKSTNSSNNGNTGFTPFPSNDYLDIQKKIELYDQTLKETLIAIRDGKLKEQQELLKENMLQQDKHLSEIANGNGNASKRNATESNSAQSLTPQKSNETSFDFSKKGKNIIKDDDGNEIEIELGYQYTIPDDLNADVYYDDDEYEIQVEEEIEEEIDDEDDQYGVEVEVDIDVDIDDRKLGQRTGNNKDNYQLDPSRTADQYIEEMVTFINQNKKFDNFLEEVSKLEHFDKFVKQSQSTTKGKKKKNSETSCEFTFEYGKDGELLNTRPDEVIKKKINNQIVKALESFKLDDPLQSYDINLNLADELAKTMQKNMFFGDDDHNSTPDGEDPNIENNYNNESNASTYRSGNIENKIELLDNSVPSSQGNAQSNNVSGSNGNPSKSKKKKKTKSKQSTFPKAAPLPTRQGDPTSTWLCEFCEYEEVYGEKPIQLMRWFDKKIREQEDRENLQRQRLRRSKNRRTIKRPPQKEPLVIVDDYDDDDGHGTEFESDDGLHDCCDGHHNHRHY